MSHPLFSDHHDLLRTVIADWARDRIAPHIDEWEAAREFPRELFVELGQLGFLGAQYPVEYGGQGADFASSLVIAEELSRIGAESVSMAVAVHASMATPPIYKFGSEEQRHRYLPPILSGHKIAALAISEPEAGSDVSGITTRATRSEDGWILNGQKTFITNGSRADVLVVIARTDNGSEDERPPAFSTFIVDADLAGVIRGRKLEKIGRHASDTTELFFDNVRLQPAALLGVEGEGFKQIMWELEAERLTSAATSVALGSHALDLAITYVKSRRQFGHPIADFQAIRHTLASHAARLTAARELVYATAVRFQNGEERLVEIAMAKLVAAEVLNDVADYALQVHGGYGYMAEYPIGRIWIDARLKRIAAGSDEVLREIIAKQLIGHAHDR